MSKDNIIPFPLRHDRYYESIMKAIEKGNYISALQLVEQLMEREPVDEEMVEMYCFCLIELGEFDEVIDFCLEFDELFPTLYRATLPYCIQALYEIGKYRQVVELYDDLDSMDQTEDMAMYYSLAIDMNMEQVELSLKKYHRAIMASDHQMAYRSMCTLIESAMYPLRSMIEQLQKPNVHPIIKTEIVLYCLEKNYTEAFVIEKFNIKQTFEVDDLYVIENHPIYTEIMDYLMKWEQQDPVIYEFAKRLVYHYFTVMYPFVMKKVDVTIFISAIEQIIYASFQLEIMNENVLTNKANTKQILEYQKQIQFCSDMYVSIYEID